MLLRISPLFVSFGLLPLALSTTACSSLTRPDEIAIVAEPPPAPVRQLPSMPPMVPAGGAVMGGAPHAPGSGG